MRRLAALAIRAVTGCNAGPSASRGSGEPFCVQDGGTFVCDGVAYPACSGAEHGGCDPQTAVRCMGCTYPAGFSCYCDDAPSTVANPLAPPDGGPFWLCVGTERTCR